MHFLLFFIVPKVLFYEEKLESIYLSKIVTIIRSINISSWGECIELNSNPSFCKIFYFYTLGLFPRAPICLLVKNRVQIIRIILIFWIFNIPGGNLAKFSASFAPNVIFEKVNIIDKLKEVGKRKKLAFLRKKIRHLFFF